MRLIKVVMNVKKLGQLSFIDINKSCVLIITGTRILWEKAIAQSVLPGGDIQ